MPRGRHGEGGVSSEDYSMATSLEKCEIVRKRSSAFRAFGHVIRFSRFSGTCEPRHGRGARHSWRARAGAPPRLRRAGTRGGGSYHPVRVARSRARGSATAWGGRRREGRERGSRGARLRRGCGEAFARDGGGDVGGDRAARAQARGVQRLHEGARDAARTLARSRARPGSPPRPPRPSPSRGGSPRGFRSVKPRAAIGKFDIAAPRPSQRDPARSAPTDPPPRPATRRDRERVTATAAGTRTAPRTACSPPRRCEPFPPPEGRCRPRPREGNRVRLGCERRSATRRNRSTR